MGYGTAPKLDRRGPGPGFPAVPAGPRRPAERTRPAAHLRGALQGDDRALPGGGVRVRDRLARRRRPAADRLRVRDRRGARADARRAAEPRRARHAAVPDRVAPGRARLPGRRSSSSSPTATSESDAEAAASAHAAYTELVLQATDKAPDPEEIEAMTAYEMAATVEFGLDAKQGLLDLRSESARMKLVARLCRAAIKRLDFVDRAQARARSPTARSTSRAEQRAARPRWRPCRAGSCPSSSASVAVGAVGEQQLGRARGRRRAPRCAAACSRPAGGRWGSAPASSSARTRRRGRGRRQAECIGRTLEVLSASASGVAPAASMAAHRLRAAEERGEVQRREAVAAAHAQVGACAAARRRRARPLRAARRARPRRSAPSRRLRPPVVEREQQRGDAVRVRSPTPAPAARAAATGTDRT